MTDSEQPDKPRRRHRGHNEGSIYRTKDGLWRGAVFLGYTVDGKPNRKYVSGKTRDEVNRKVTQLRAKHQQGLPIATAAPTVAEFLETWLRDVIKPNRGEGTYVAYESAVRVHLVPALGRHRIDKLTPRHVQAMLAAKQDAGLSGARLRMIRAILRAALNQAMRWELVSRNVAALTDPPKSKPFTGKPLSSAEATAFLTAAKGDRLEALYVTAIWLGLRKGELFGLRWQDIDFDGRSLTVAKQLQRIGSKPQIPVLVDPKSATSKRQLPLPAPVARALQEHRRRQLEDHLLAGGRWQGSAWGLVFCTTIGTPLDERTTDKQYQALLAAAGIERRRFHDLRHSTGTFLTAKGVHPRVIMQILGHSQIAITMDRYAHVDLATMRTALDDLSDLMDEA